MEAEECGKKSSPDKKPNREITGACENLIRTSDRASSNLSFLFPPFEYFLKF